MKDFLNIDYQIDLNEKRLEFYNTNYQKTQTKFALIMIFYSAFSVYLIQLLYLVKDCIIGNISELTSIFYIFVLVTFLIFLGKSIYFTAKFLIPIEIAYLELPEVFYKKVKQMYIDNGITQDNLNSKIKDSYLLHQEDSLKKNRDSFEKKSELFYKALINSVIALIPFILALSVYYGYKSDVQKIIIENIEQLK